VKVVVGALLVLGAGPTPVNMFTVTGTMVRCSACLFFKNGKRRVCLPRGVVPFTALPIFWRRTRGALRRSKICGSGDGFPFSCFGGVGSSSARECPRLYAAVSSAGTSAAVSVGVVGGIGSLDTAFSASGL
jgi:hypothetical protein